MARSVGDISDISDTSDTSDIPALPQALRGPAAVSSRIARPKRARSAQRRRFWRPAPVATFAVAAALVGIVVAIVFAPETDDARVLARGNEAFRDGRFAEAATIYEESGEPGDRMTRLLNAGLAHRAAGDIDRAVERFEKVSTSGDAALETRAFQQLGSISFAKGRAAHDEVDRPPPGASSAGDPSTPPTAPVDDEQEFERKKTALENAARSFRAASEFFHRVEPPHEDVVYDIEVTKIALRQVLDELTRLLEEKARRDEDEALAKPAELLVRLLGEEGQHRALARAAASTGGRGQRLASRQLRQAEAKTRALAERLVNYLGRPRAENEPEPAEDEKARTTQAITTIAAAVEAQKEAEIAYAAIDPKNAVEPHGRAIESLRHARELFELDIGQLTAAALETARGVLAGAERLDPSTDDAKTTAGRGAGIGRTILETLEDKVLRPLARLLSPTEKAEIAVLIDAEDDVIWSAGILSRAEIPPTPAGDPAAGPAGATGHPGGVEPGQPQLDEAQAKELSEKIRAQGQIALDRSTAAREALGSERLPVARSAQAEAIAALEAILALLPKPEPTVVEKLRQMIARQREAESSAGGLEEVEGDARREAAQSLARAQEVDAGQAAAIADELAGGPQADATREAVEKVRAGQDRILASSLALDRVLAQPAVESIQAAITALEEALAMLENPEDQDESGDDQQQQNAGQKGGYQLDPRRARMLQEEMDRKRREEMEKLYSGPSTFTVERDW